MTTEANDRDTNLAPDEAFGLLGNDTRIDILQTLWDKFESGLGGNTISYSELFEEVDYHDSGNFSYHLEKLTGPFIRETTNGYELKQTGINVIRAVVTGTVIEEPEFGPTQVDVTCPRCDSPVEIAYADEVMRASCAECDGIMRWNDDPGILYLGLVPPALMDQRSIEESFRAAVTFTMYQLAAIQNDVCPQCASVPNRRLEVCREHQTSTANLCPNCERHNLAAAWMVCRTCKWRVFPPAIVTLLTNPDVISFHREHGFEHRFPSWEGFVRTFDFEEEFVSEDPLRIRYTVPAEDDELRLTLDGDVNVVEVTR